MSNLNNMKIAIRKWVIRLLSTTISKQEALKLGLKFDQNIYGDMINNWNCRSIWRDKERNIYRVSELISKE